MSKPRKKRRYAVQAGEPRSQNPLDHTWDVIDRWRKDKVIANFSLRATAREEAAELNLINKEAP